MKQRQLRADLALLLVALIWGATFVMVKEAVTNFPVFAFLALRFALAFAALLIIIWWRENSRKNKEGMPSPSLGRGAIRAGVLIGLLLFAGYAFQTVGLRYTSPGKAGFITGLSVAIVPLFSALLLRRSPSRSAILGVTLATVGLALLSLRDGWTIARGDAIVLGCAFAFALHIISVGAFAPRMDTLNLTAIQIATVALVSGLISLATERPWPTASQAVCFAALFTGIFATSLAFAVQNAAQRFTSPTHTALIFSTEPIFAALFSYLLAGERLSGRGLVGCGLILTGMITAELGKEG
ncbi:MAG: DMT family transporter [Chloroflexota bacterium]|nr:DMT family transporter [Chloroflexota bacterium]